MLLPDLLNSNEYFLYFASINKEKDEKFDFLKTEILTRSTSALLHIIKIKQLNSECVTEFNLFEDQLNIQDKRIVYTSVTMGFLLNEISPLLSTLRHLQNLIMGFISNIEKISLPSSAAKFCKNPNKYGVSTASKELIEDYWASTGNNLKSYRDVDQHFGSLIDNYFLEITPDKKVILQFPDNPEVKSINKFKFSKDINGLDFLNSTFNELHNIFESLSKVYGAKEGSHSLSISLKQIGTLLPAR